MQLFKRTNFDFIGKRYYAYALSGLLVGAGLISLVIKGGPKLGIDFTGGTLVQLAFKTPVPIGQLREALRAGGHPEAELQDSSEQKSVLVRVPKSDKSAPVLGEELKKLVAEKFAGSEPEVQRAEFVGPAVGRALSRQAFLASFWAAVLIIIYVAFRFRSMLWGFCSVVAVIHDVLSIVGVFSLLNKDITITVVAGILTLAGYSMNDTIVIYDRMRENLRLSRKEDLASIINRSVNETLSRTIMTSVTVALVVLVLFFFGGSVIHDFSFAMLWGVFVGSYSTIFVAAPIIYEFQSRERAAAPVAVKGRVPVKK